VQRSFLVSLVSQYDAFIRLLLTALLLTNRNILKSSHKSIEKTDLLPFNMIDETYEWFAEQLIDEVIRTSHSEQFDFIESTLHVKWTRNDDPLWRAFIEITERRNLFVHTDGIVSDQYREVCRKNDVLMEAGIKKGMSLMVSSEYFKRACQTLVEMGIKLAQILWRKHLPEGREEADSSIQKITLIC